MNRLWIAVLAVALAACGGEGRIYCASGTQLQNGTCVPFAELPIVCGPGTHAAGDLCVSDSTVLSCGAGTWTDGNVCRPTSSGGGLVCGAGTHASGTACVPDGAVSCGAGTHASGSTCVPDAGLSCGAGTHAVGSVCMPDPPMTCGAGTHVAGTSCVADALLACGAGTHPEGGRCVRDATTTFEVRVAATSIPANGYSKIPVLVLGTTAEGAPSTADVVLWVSRPGAGTFSPAAFPLGAMGTTAWFVPCSTTSPGCTGTFEINVSLATDPFTVVASSGPLELVAPAGVGSTAPCLVGGNVLFFDGNDYIFNGTQTVRLGTFSASGGATDVRLWITPSTPGQGMWWDLEFSSAKLGSPLATQVYEEAQRAAFASPGHPGIDIGGDGRGCNTISGRFQVHELVWANASMLSRFTATWEQHCEGGTSVLRGCVHYEQ